MIFRLTYCNRFGDTARIDIQTPGNSTVMEVEGTGTPFNLQYKNDKSDKSGNFRTSSAEINIYETPEFNIDTLKTSSETDIKVDYYINDVKKWTGYVIPDFFSREIGGNGVVSMVASDRISTLKGVTLSELPEFISIRELAVECLEKTGLNLPLKTMADFSAGSNANDFYNSEILSQRLIDTKGRSISCYDILNSILIASNSLIIQRNAEWYIVNKFQHENGTGRLYNSDTSFTNWEGAVHNFNEITKGAIRSIIPVAASVGIFHEHGGGRLHPENYDFTKGMEGWTPFNGFNYDIGNREIRGFTNPNIQSPYADPEYGDETKFNYLLSVRNKRPYSISGSDYNLDTFPYVESVFDIISTDNENVEISVDFSCIGPHETTFTYSIIADNGTRKYALNRSGSFANYDPKSTDFALSLYNGKGGSTEALTKNQQRKGVFEVSGVTGYKLKVRIYGAGSGTNTNPNVTAAINFLSIKFKNTSETPKGNLYKREQGGNYTKIHDIETSIFGDFITGGLNGYFYDYPIDDTSSLFSPNGDLRSIWTSPGEPEERPLLLHSVRQKARMFSIAHDLVSGEIDIVHFDPLAIFQDCSGKRYTIVSADVDFFNSVVKVDIEEIAFQSLPVRDFIYSYFGEGESGISSVGGIASGTGGGAGGGGMTSEQLSILNNLASWWKLDEEGNLYTDLSVYSTLEVSAYGKGTGLIEGGSLAGLLDVKLTDLQQGQGLRFNGTHWVNAPWPEGGGGSASNVIWGNTLDGYSPLSVDGLSKTVALSGHEHTWENVTDKPTTFAPSAHTHAWNSITNTPTTLTGYGILGTDTLFDNKYLKLTGGTLTGDLHTPGVSLIGASNGIRFTKTGSPAYWAWINNDNRLALGNGASATSMSIDNVGNIGAPSVITALDDSYFLQNSKTNPFLRLKTTSDTWYLQASESHHGAYISNELSKGLRISKEGYLGINVFDNYADAEFISFHLRGGHSSTRFRMEALTGQTGAASNSILSMWASEPSVSYHGAGIGENINGSPYYGRVNEARGASYMRFFADTIVFGSMLASGNTLEGLSILHGGKIRPTSTNTRAAGLYGAYDSARAAHIWSIGEQYAMSNDGLSFGNMYGLAYKYANTIAASHIGTQHMIAGVLDGTVNFELGLSGSAWFAQNITASAYKSLGIVTIDKQGYLPTGDYETQSHLILQNSAVTNSRLAIGINPGYGSWIESYNHADSTGLHLSLNPRGGNVGIGTLLPAVKLDVQGSIRATGEITAYVASDRRLKKGISPIFNALDTIDRLSPMMYYWNEKAMELNPLKTKGTDFGLIAQEVEGVLPGVIHDVYGDYKAIDYVKLIPFLIGAIKELRKEVKSLNIK